MWSRISSLTSCDSRQPAESVSYAVLPKNCPVLCRHRPLKRVRVRGVLTRLEQIQRKADEENRSGPTGSMLRNGLGPPSSGAVVLSTGGVAIYAGSNPRVTKPIATPIEHRRGADSSLAKRIRCGVEIDFAADAAEHEPGGSHQISRAVPLIALSACLCVAQRTNSPDLCRWPWPSKS